MQYLDNFKLFTKEEYTVTKPRSKKSSMTPRFKLRTDQPTSLVFFSILVEFHRDRGIE